MKESTRSTYCILIAVVALLLSILAFLNSKQAKDLALSEIAIEEGATWIQPVYDEETNRFYHLAFYEVHVSNLSGPSIILKQIAPPSDDAGFIVALKNQQVQPTDLQAQAFYLHRTLQEVQTNPKLLKEVATDALNAQRMLNLAIKPGESKTVRFGVNLYPYDAQGQQLADMALLSFRFIFDNGKTHLFRRGFPILPVAPTP